MLAPYLVGEPVWGTAIATMWHRSPLMVLAVADFVGH